MARRLLKAFWFLSVFFCVLFAIACIRSGFAGDILRWHLAGPASGGVAVIRSGAGTFGFQVRWVFIPSLGDGSVPTDQPQEEQWTVVPPSEAIPIAAWASWLQRRGFFFNWKTENTVISIV